MSGKKWDEMTFVEKYESNMWRRDGPEMFEGEDDLRYEAMKREHFGPPLKPIGERDLVDEMRAFMADERENGTLQQILNWWHHFYAFNGQIRPNSN